MVLELRFSADRNDVPGMVHIMRIVRCMNPVSYMMSLLRKLIKFNYGFT